MELEILVSTMNKISIKELELEKKNIYSNCLIINQVTDKKIALKNEEIKSKNIRMVSFREEGLSNSRNRAIQNAKGKVCIIADDDVFYTKSALKNVEKAFEENEKSDIITFQTITPDSEFRKKYSKSPYTHSIKTLKKVSSIEIAFRLESILKNKIMFDNRFGLGSEYGVGEEAIFLMDSRKKGLKLTYVPVITGVHPIESTSVAPKESFRIKGAMSKRMFPKIYLIINIIIALKTKSTISFFKKNVLLNNGANCFSRS